jgi:hypothetical protein
MMRKLFVALLVGAVAVGLAAPAFAADLKFTGAYRFRFQFDENLPCFGDSTLADCDGHDFQSRFRPRFEVETEGGVKGVIYLEIGDLRFGTTAKGTDSAAGTNSSRGSVGGAGADAVNIETKNAYIEFPLPATPLRLRAGVMGFYTSKALVLDDDGPGLTLYGKVAEVVDLKAWWYRANSTVAVNAQGQNARDIYAVDVTLSPLKDLSLNGYLLYDHDMEIAPTGKGYWLGLGAKGNFGVVRFDADFVYGTKETAVAGVDKKGYLFDVGVGTAIAGIDLEARLWYATGDENNGGDNEGFPSLYSGANDHFSGAQIWGGNTAIDIDDNIANSPENTMGIGVIARFTASPSLKLSGNIHYIDTIETGTAALPSPAGDGRIFGVSSIGFDVGVRMDYTLAKGLVFTVTASRLFLDDDTSISGTTFDDVTKLAAVVNYGF